MKTIFEVIEQRLSELKKSNVWLAHKMETSPQNVNNWKARGVPPKAITKISKVLGIDRDSLERGELKRLQEISSLPNSQLSNIKPVLSFESPQELPAGHFVMVRRVEAVASAGNGAENGDLIMDAEPVAFRADWIKKSKAVSTNVVVITVNGDSMHPTIFDGDDALIDLDQTQIRNGYVYAFVVGGEMMVKRLSKNTETVIAHSDNESDPRYKYDEEYSQDSGFRVIGRVVNRSGAGSL